jgi:hypothetical protein
MLAWALLAVHGATLIAAIANPLPLWAKIFLLSVTVGSWTLSLRHYIFEPAVIAIVRKPDGAWILTVKGGNTIAGRLQGSTLVTIWFTLLHLDTDAGPRTVLLCRDGLDPETYRLLRVSLKVDAAPGTP